MNTLDQPASLRRRSELSQLSLDAAGLPIVTFDAAGMILYANPAMGELLGVDEAELIGTLHPTYGEPSLRRRLQELADAPRTEAASGFEVETWYAHRDGSTAWTSEKVTVARGQPDEAPLFVAVARDISQEKSTELENRKFRYLSDETSEAHFLINARGRIVWANNAACLITGLTRDELQRTLITEIWDAMSDEEFAEIFTRASHGRLPATDGVFLRKDGAKRSVKINLQVSEFAGEPLLSALVGDYTENQRVREALRESEARLRIAVDLAQLSVYGWDPATGALSWDARLKAMWGLPPDAYVDYEVFWSGVHPDDKPMVDRAIKRTLDPADGFYQAEFRVIGLQDHVERWVAACGQTFFKDGKPIGYIGAARDVTDRKRTETDLEQVVAERTQELRSVIAELEAFSYSISHDMRAPLRAIQGFAQILEEDCRGQVGPVGKEYIRRIVTAADRMDHLIQGALTYSRLSRTEVPMENIDLASLVNGILEGYPQFQSPAADIRVQFPLPRVRGNVAALTQCLSNLIGNAVKFVAPGVVPKIDISAKIVGARVRISIKDNGVGIDSVVHDKIFELFYRLDPKREGTGVGLSVARRAAERMNGSISLRSTPGQGSTFTLELDAASWT